jgi:thiol-disulfide isomerase/thioredoxin
MKIKSLIFFIVCLFLAGNTTAQIHLLHNYDLARSIAGKSGRLILMDFWASWCGPCKVMDQELWQSPEIQKVSTYFVGVQIDVEAEKTLVARYGVKSIPRVIIITINGDIIWDQKGYDNAGSFLRAFEALPENVGELNKKLLDLADNKNDLQSNYSVGLEFQNLGKNINDIELKNTFMNRSETYLRKTLKLCNDTVIAEEIELNSIMNDVYCGRYEKAFKMIEKMNPESGNENLSEFRHFILAKCYKNTNDQDNYQKEKQLVTKRELLDQLEN